MTWSKSARVTVVAIIVILVGLFINSIRPLISPMSIAALGAYILHPLVCRIEKKTRFKRQGAVALVYFPFLALLIATPGTLLPVLVRQIRTLSDDFVVIFNQLEAFLSEPVTIFNLTISQEQLAQFLDSATKSFIPAAEDAIHVLETTSTSLLWLVVILVTIYYLLLDWEGLRDWFIGMAPAGEQADILRLFHEIDFTWRAYMRGTLTLMFIMGIFFAIVGLAIGLPGAVALGLLTGLLSMIPEIGPTIGGVISVLIALFEGSNFLPLSDFWFAVLVGAIYVVVMQVKSLWLRPIVMGRFMHLNTGLVFVAIIGSALLFGIWEAFIILPVMATVGQIGKYLRSRLLGLDPWRDTAVATSTDREGAS